MPHNFSNRSAIVFLSVLVGLSVFLWKDLSLRSSFSAMYGELNSLNKNVMTPAGAVQQPGQEQRGDGLLDTIINCGPDVTCPTVGAGWYVPVESGKEQEFAKAMLEQQGYRVGAGGLNACSLEQTSDCGVTGRKDNYDIGVSVRKVGSQTSTAPSSNVSPKIWRDVSVRITRL